MAYGGRTEFRASRGLQFFGCLVAIIFLAVSVVAYIQDSEFWIVAICGVLFVIGLVGIAEIQSSFVILDQSHLRMRKTFRLTVVARDDIESVEVANGCPVTLTLKSGRYITIPDLGPRGIGNSLRAWIKNS